jgi:TolA-binding protein
MTKPATPLTEAELSEAYRALADEHVAQHAAVGRQQVLHLIELKQQRLQPLARRRRWAWMAVASALALGVLGFGYHQSRRTLDYEITGGRVDGPVIRANEQPAVVSFSDESRVEADPHTTFTVDIVGQQAAVTHLSRGTLHVRVQHRDSTDWRFFAGPYELRVIGTRFDLSWDPDHSRLSVVMHEGQLLVTREDVQGRLLSAGQKVVLEDEPTPQPEQPQATQTARGLDGPSAEIPRASQTNTRQPKAAPSVPTFSQLLAKGRFDEVVSAAEAEGVEQALASKPSSELHALAQAARYTGNVALAVRSWTTLRERFPGSSHGSQAAFFMARAYEEQGKLSLALKWLDTYLQEAPSGVYAADALGRKLSLVQRTQGPERARSVAREYLLRFPEGSSARTARDMLSRE